MKIITLMNELGLIANERGVCYGLAAMGAQACLINDNEYEVYCARLKLIDALEENSQDVSDMKQLFLQCRNPLNYKNVPNYTNLLDIFIFLQSVSLYQSPDQYRETFEKGQ